MTTSTCSRHGCAVLLSAWALVLALAACTAPPPAGDEEAVTPVRIRVLREGTLLRSVDASATLSAEHRATVAARVGGPLLMVADEGTRVTADDSVVMRVDAESLQHQVGVAEQDVAVAQRAVTVHRADHRRILADLAKAETDAVRFRRLHDDEGAVSAEAAEAQEARLAQVQASAEAAEAAVALAEQQLVQARHGLAIAQRALADATLTAPLSGVVVRRHRETGEMIGPGAAVLQIEDPSLLRLSLHLNAAHRPLLTPEDTVLEILDGPAAGHRLPISFIAPTIDPILRTIEVRALWQDPPPGVMSGQAVRVRVVLETVRGLIAPDDAVLRRADGAMVALAVDDQARLVPVQRRLRVDDQVIIDGEDAALRSGAHIIIAGHDRLVEGQAIRAVAQPAAASIPTAP